MNIFLGILLLLVLGYVVLIAFYLKQWESLQTCELDKADLKPLVSIIVPIRNEEKGIVNCIDSLVNQVYKSSYEIIVVDDFSTDNTWSIVESHYGGQENIILVSMAEMQQEISGKKAALTHGIEIAKGEIVVTIDGDCIAPNNWLAYFSSCFDLNTQIVTGPVVYKDATGAFSGFQALDLLSLILATVAGIQSKSYFMGNGANLAFRKSAYRQVQGYLGNSDFASGDDLFLIQKVIKHYGVGAMRYAKSPQTQVSTSPEENLSAFIAQRMRWASKNSALPSRTIQFLWGFIWLVNVAFVALVALTIAAQVSWGVAICALLVKLLVEGFALNSVASYFKLDKLMRWFPIAFGLNIIYVFVIGILAMLKPTFEWKGRKLNK